MEHIEMREQSKQMDQRALKLGTLIGISKGKKHLIAEKGFNRYINIEDLHNPSNRTFTNDLGISVNENDLIIAWDGANAGKVGVGLSGVIGSTLARLRLNNKTVDSKFLFWFLESKNELIKSQRTGATIPHINGNALKDLQIPLPPIETQKRIAAILDKADALRRKDQELLQKYDDLAQAVFMDMFGDPVKNEKGWEVKKLGESIISITAGSSFGGEEKDLAADELGVMKVSAVTSGQFKPDEFKAVKKSIIKKEIVKVRAGDFLFSRANTRDLVGATCIVDKDYDNLFLPDKLWKICFRKSCSSFFMKAILSHKAVRYELNKTATGTSGSMLNISMQKLKDLEVIIPPENLQLKFEKAVLGFSAAKSNLRSSSNFSNFLFQSLLQKAFTGELVA